MINFFRRIFKKAAPLPPIDEIIERLNNKASEIGGYWQVWDTANFMDTESAYQGTMTIGGPFNIYYDDGGVDYWSVYKFDTAQECAYTLLNALNKPPNCEVEYRRKKSSVKLNGGPNV